jgi:hypothetical protein
MLVKQLVKWRVACGVWRVACGVLLQCGVWRVSRELCCVLCVVGGVPAWRLCQLIPGRSNLFFPQTLCTTPIHESNQEHESGQNSATNAS